VKGSKLVAAAPEESCKSGSWIAAFFVEGIGPRPTGPVTLYYVTNGRGHRLEIDPDKHTVRADVALRLEPADFGGATWVSPISYRAAGSTPPSLPVLGRRDLTGWRIDGGGTSMRHFGWSEYRGMQGPVPVITEWRLYLLSLPDGCAQWYGRE
jgi:hypothetical protein